MKTKPRLEFSPETIHGLALMLASYRLDGCKDGAARAVQDATKKAAQKHRRPYSELWALVHQAAYVIIDADPRSA